MKIFKKMNQHRFNPITNASHEYLDMRYGEDMQKYLEAARKSFNLPEMPLFARMDDNNKGRPDFVDLSIAQPFFFKVRGL